MKVAIDGVGRMVVPKSLRRELGINGPTELELKAADGRLELTVPDVPVRVVEREGLPVITPEHDVPSASMSVDEVRKAIDGVRS